MVWPVGPSCSVVTPVDEGFVSGINHLPNYWWLGWTYNGKTWAYGSDKKTTAESSCIYRSCPYPLLLLTLHTDCCHMGVILLSCDVLKSNAFIYISQYFMKYGNSNEVYNTDFLYASMYTHTVIALRSLMCHVMFNSSLICHSMIEV
jgi:hypothetical protein